MRDVFNHKMTLYILTILVAFCFQGSRGLYETTEGRYAESALEMIQSGNYLTPFLDYRPHWTKPPLTYWAIAAGVRLLGPNEWGVRLYNAIAFCFIVLAIVAIGRVLWDSSAGLAAGFIYLSSPFPVFGAYSVSTDTLLTLWGTLAALCYLKAFHRFIPRKYMLGWVLGMWCFFGLAFLTKGPPALLAFAAFSLFHVIKKRSLKILLHPLGLCLFVFIGFSWYGYMTLGHSGLTSYWLGEEVVARITSEDMNRNPEWYKPFIIYLPILTFGLGPWLYYLIRLLIRERFLNIRYFMGCLLQGNHRFFLLLWFLLPLVIFWIVKSRLPLYLLPLFVPLTIAIGREVSSNALNEPKNSKVILIAIVTSILLISMKGFLALYPHQNDMKALYKLCCVVNDQGSYEVVAVDESKLYGLQFYLNGKLERVSSNRKAPWSYETLEEEMNEFYSRPSYPCHIFVTGKSKSAALEASLQQANLPYQRRENRYWVIFVVGRGTIETS